jgi:hypothetical protein
LTSVAAASIIGTPAIRYQEYDGKYSIGNERLKILISGAMEKQRKRFDELLVLYQKADRVKRDTRRAECIKRPKLGFTLDVTISAITINSK